MLVVSYIFIVLPLDSCEAHVILIVLIWQKANMPMPQRKRQLST